MIFKDIVKAHWSNTTATKGAAELAMDYLSTLPDETRVGTGELVRALGGKMDDIKPFASHLTNARKDGLLDGYFSTGKKGAFGRPSIIWHNDPARLT